MRAKLIAALAVLALVAALCAASLHEMASVCAEMENLRGRALAAERAGDGAGAEDALRRMQRLWDGSEKTLEILTTHASLAQVERQLIESRSWLEAGERPHFRMSMALLGDALKQAYDLQAPILSYIL